MISENIFKMEGWKVGLMYKNLLCLELLTLCNAFENLLAFCSYFVISNWESDDKFSSSNKLVLSFVWEEMTGRMT